jgi:5-methyltetrahydropteroyltriglutamate--homocysteine methyltransferase
MPSTPIDRIITTHVGSLPRPASLVAVMQARAEGRAVDEGERRRLLRDGVRDVVRSQVELGIDVVSDGELSKASYATYVDERLSGFGGPATSWTPADLRDVRDFATYLARIHR